MAQGCAAALVRSGERGRHPVYLESAVRRTRDSPKKCVFFILQTLTWLVDIVAPWRACRVACVGRKSNSA
eukprot:7260507-Prymnesium_polylepis.1